MGSIADEPPAQRASHRKSKQRQRVGAFDRNPGAATRKCGPKQRFQLLAAAQALFVAIGAAVSERMRFRNETYKLRIAQPRRFEATVVDAAHANGRTMKPVCEYTQHLLSIDDTGEK